jgi:hypothetical protein
MWPRLVSHASKSLRQHRYSTTERKHTCKPKSIEDTSYERPERYGIDSGSGVGKTRATFQQNVQRLTVCYGIGGAQYDECQSEKVDSTTSSLLRLEEVLRHIIPSIVLPEVRVQSKRIPIKLPIIQQKGRGPA